MNRNPKEKFARIDIRVNQKDKDKIKRFAEKYNLSISEYLVQRALGYEPITVLPDLQQIVRAMQHSGIYARNRKQTAFTY